MIESTYTVFKTEKFLMYSGIWSLIEQFLNILDEKQIDTRASLVPENLRK